METPFYLSEFEKAASGLDAGLLAQKGLDVEVGIWLRSVVLRMHKKTWANKPFERPQSDAAIFFSIWLNLNDKGVKAGRLFYNIHALKLRQLRGYRITSREFAADFRARFQPFARHWPNVSVDFGPLTLMEGWLALDAATLTAAAAPAEGETEAAAPAIPASSAVADPVTEATADQAPSAVAAQVSALATAFLELAPLIDSLLERRGSPR
jgi:hypothetical protein